MSDIENTSQDEINAMLAELEADEERQFASEYVPMLIKVLQPHGSRGLFCNFVIDQVERMRRDAGLHIVATHRNTVQSFFNAHNPASSCFGKKSKAEALFCAFGDMKERRWAVIDAERATRWLKRRKYRR
jgi:hypothetical protein